MIKALGWSNEVDTLLSLWVDIKTFVWFIFHMIVAVSGVLYFHYLPQWMRGWRDLKGLSFYQQALKLLEATWFAVCGQGELGNLSFNQIMNISWNDDKF